VLNNTPHQVIPERTRQRVLAAAGELGYTPSAAARTLVSGRSDVVLLLLPDWPIGPEVGRLLEDLSAALAGHGLTFVAHPRAAGRPVAEVWKAITPAAVISFEELEDQESARLRAAGVELTVALFGGGKGSRALDIPEQRAGRLQAEHLAVAGHRHLGYAWPEDERVVAFAQPRLDGVRQTCADLGLPEPHVLPVPLDAERAAEAVGAWRGSDPAVTGVCAYNDEVALAVLSGARRRGVDVPGDLAVIGVDNTHAGRLTTPALSTVESDLGAISRYIADSISHTLHGRPAPERPGSGIHSVIPRESA
jgi:DNA-binding LacI/PurR family transcriptional regulator